MERATKKRTEGLLSFNGKEFYTYDKSGRNRVYLVAAVDTRAAAKLSKEDADHLTACWNAIERNGGDPSIVGRLVDALQSVARSPRGKGLDVMVVVEMMNALEAAGKESTE